MQQASPHDRAEYASLAMRFAAVVVDMLVLFGLLILVIGVYVFVLASQGKIDPGDPDAAQELSRQIAASELPVNVLFFAALFAYYVLLEAVFAASVGKLVFGMRVVMRDGTRATGLAVLLRNVVRIPEAMLLYIPAAISCLASAERQRLGDHVARTVVVRRQAARATAPQGRPQASSYGPAGGTAGEARAGEPVPPPVAPAAAWPQPPAPGPAPPAEPPTLDGRLAELKTAALAARGAHLTYLHFSEQELAAGGGLAGTGDDESAPVYSEEYVSAWFTLTGAVGALREARAALDVAAASAGRSLDDVTAAQPDLAHLLDALAPYLGAASDEEVHAAFLAVARAEAPAP